MLDCSIVNTLGIILWPQYIISWPQSIILWPPYIISWPCFLKKNNYHVTSETLSLCSYLEAHISLLKAEMKAITERLSCSRLHIDQHGGVGGTGGTQPI